MNLQKLLLTSPGPGIVRRGLVGWYRFAETGQILQDYSGSGKNGTLGSTAGADANDPTWGGGGLQFATDDYVGCGTVLGAKPAFTYTLAASFPALPTGVVANQYHLMGRFGTAGNRATSCRLFNPTTLTLGTSNDGTADAYGAVTIPEVLINTPAAYTFSLENGMLTIYVNGVKIGTASGLHTVIFASSPKPFTFGMTSESFGPVTGTLNYALLHEGLALKDAEVKQEYRFIRKDLAQRGVALP